MQLWAILGDLGLPERIKYSHYTPYYELGHLGFSFDTLPLQNKDKCIYGFGPAVPLLQKPGEVSSIRVLSAGLVGNVKLETEVFRQYLKIDSCHTVYCITCWITDEVYTRLSLIHI